MTSPGGKFERLMRAGPEKSPAEQGQMVEQEFPLIVHHSNLHYWRPNN
jgi:hypothetical protein